MALYGIGAAASSSLAAAAIRDAAAQGDVRAKVALAGCLAYGTCGPIAADVAAVSAQAKEPY